jgi:hypothetical protein
VIRVECDIDGSPWNVVALTESAAVEIVAVLLRITSLLTVTKLSPNPVTINTNQGAK